MEDKVKISEIFTSIQGEGLYIGVNQLFIRFASCNLNCAYCDTDFKTNAKEYTISELIKIINQTENIHSVSLTGGEPLLNAGFLVQLLPLTDKKIYLETNGTLFENLNKIIDFVDIIATDIKLPSATRMSDMFNHHQKFIKCAVEHKKEIFLKTVFDENITNEEIENIITLAKPYNLAVVLQPKMVKNKLLLNEETINKVYNKLISQYNKVRLIPQVHKFLNVR